MSHFIISHNRTREIYLPYVDEPMLPQPSYTVGVAQDSPQ